MYIVLVAKCCNDKYISVGVAEYLCRIALGSVIGGLFL